MKMERSDSRSFPHWDYLHIGTGFETFTMFNMTILNCYSAQMTENTEKHIRSLRILIVPGEILVIFKVHKAILATFFFFLALPLVSFKCTYCKLLWANVIVPGM